MSLSDQAKHHDNTLLQEAVNRRRIIDLVRQKLGELIVHDSTEQELKDVVLLLEELETSNYDSETARRKLNSAHSGQIYDLQKENERLKSANEKLRESMEKTWNDLISGSHPTGGKVSPPNILDNRQNWMEQLSELIKEASKSHSQQLPQPPNYMRDLSGTFTVAELHDIMESVRPTPVTIDYNFQIRHLSEGVIIKNKEILPKITKTTKIKDSEKSTFEPLRPVQDEFSRRGISHFIIDQQQDFILPSKLLDRSYPKNVMDKDRKY